MAIRLTGRLSCPEVSASAKCGMVLTGPAARATYEARRDAFAADRLALATRDRRLSLARGVTFALGLL
ncbi:MAG TPA: hypothetical protein VFM29_05280, partial [Vicinamibacteria bacterium]|nr:hypothetical protein [Vicinamibacteria bacterium]